MDALDWRREGNRSIPACLTHHGVQRVVGRSSETVSSLFARPTMKSLMMWSVMFLIVTTLYGAIETGGLRTIRRSEKGRELNGCGPDGSIDCRPEVLNRREGSGGALTLGDANVRWRTPRELWSSGFNHEMLSGLATLKRDTSVVTTTADLSGKLVNGDLIRIGNENDTVKFEVGDLGPDDPNAGLLLVKDADTPFMIRLAYVYRGPSLIRRQIYKRQVSADEIIRRVRESAALRNEERLKALEKKERADKRRAIERKKLEEAEKRLQDAIVEEMKSNPPRLNCTGPVLSGVFDALKGSKVVRTSEDVREEIKDGERIQFNGYDAMYVVSQPRDVRTVTLSVPYVDEDHSSLKACKVVDQGGGTCTPLSGCFDVIMGSHVVRTSKDIRMEIEPGEIIRLMPPEGRVEASVTDPRDGRTLSLSGEYPSKSADCIEACKVRNTWDGGTIPLCGNVSVTKGSSVVTTSCDLRDSLSLGDLIKIGRHVSSLTSPFDDIKLTLEKPYPDADASGLKAYKQVREVPLSGTVSVVKGSKIVTTTSDLREEIRPGDMIKIYQRPNHPDVFTLIAPTDSTMLSIAIDHPGPSGSGYKAYKIAGTMNPLSGTVSVTKGSADVVSTMDLRGELIPGDTVQIENFDGVVEDVKEASFTLDAPYDDETMSGVPAFKKGKSAELSTLQQLNAQKMACTTIYCIQKIEEQERALTFGYSRQLRAGFETTAGNRDMTGAGNVVVPGDEGKGN